jgi:hypothetical protein
LTGAEFIKQALDRNFAAIQKAQKAVAEYSSTAAAPAVMAGEAAA